MAIKENIAMIKERMLNAAVRSGRQVGDVHLLMATKTVPANIIIEAFEAGETLIGENKVQELVEKADALASWQHEAHFIGHLQSNKIKDVIKHASCIQSIDRLEIAEKLEKRLASEDRLMDIFVQINTSKEISKFGCTAEESIPLVEKIRAFEHLRIRGLMTIGLFSDDIKLIRPCYKMLYNIKQQIEDAHLVEGNLELSMGMSGDFEIAIEEGATIVRVGTSIFGKRVYPDSYYWNEQK